MTGRIRRSISSSINAAERIVSWAFCAKALTERSRDLLLHPVRLRIVQALVKQPMTASGLKEVLGDVAQATLYRHIKALENGGMLDIVAERQVRGTVERTYRVVESAVALSAEDLADAGNDDHFRYFATFVGTLLADYSSYLETDTIDLAADRVGYRQIPLWLSDDELDDFTTELRALLQERLDNQPSPQRRRRLLTTIIMPDDHRLPERERQACWSALAGALRLVRSVGTVLVPSSRTALIAFSMSSNAWRLLGDSVQ
jgi:DNA-binding transcriptional ArsR family regulator